MEQTPLRILVGLHCLNQGGMERRSVLLANAFARAGHRVQLCSVEPALRLRELISDAVAFRELGR